MQIDQRTNNYTNKDYAVALAKIIVLSGVSSEIEEYETQIIIEWLKKHFRPRPHPSKAHITIYSPDYLVKIWEYGTGGSFKMPENYAKLSCEYIGKVITAFKEWRRNVNMRPKQEKEVPQLPPKSETESDKSIVLSDFKRFKEKGMILLGAVCYDALVSLGHFDSDIYDGYMEQADIMERSERNERGKASGSLVTLRSLMNSITPSTVKSRAKEMAVMDYFKTLDEIEL